MDQSSTKKDSTSQSEDNAADDTPPPYTDSIVAQCARIQTDWITSRPKGWPRAILNVLTPMIRGHWAPPQPLRSLKDRLLGKHHGPVKDQWRADMTLVTCNLPRLMRKGLYWTGEDIWETKSFIKPNSSRRGWLSGCWGGWKHARCICIRPRGERCEWEARIYIFARDPSTLVQFDISDLTPDRITSMYAFGWGPKAVYQFLPKHPERNFNKIHGSMPLKGLWPWPKAENEDIESEKEQESENTEGIMEAGIMLTPTDWNGPGKAQRTSNLENPVEWFLAT